LGTLMELMAAAIDGSSATLRVRCNPEVHVAEIALSCSTWILEQSYGSMVMAWTTPVLVEICIGLEINAYAPAEF